MTNFDRWQILMRNCTSPQLWIDFGFYYLIAAALQRRVWFNANEPDKEQGELFLNPYYVFVGPPGMGKGAVTRPVAAMLRCHRYLKGVPIKTSIGTELPLLFPMGADSITFEQLLSAIAIAIRRVPLPKGSYHHCSYAFVLEEMDSLFKTKTQDVAAFLKNAYDCVPYSYETKHQGVFHLRNTCLSFLAGTQPDFLYNARKSGLFGQGFASRALLLFENKRRFSRFHTTELEPDQLIAKAELNEWIVRLATAYGRITYSDSTREFLEHWETQVNDIDEQRCSPRMQEYFGRKKVSMLKLAGAMHFAESLEMTEQRTYEVPQIAFECSIEVLTALERSMEIGLGGVGRNPLHNYNLRILEFIRNQKQTVAEEVLILHFSADMEMKEVREALATLVTSGQILEQLKANNKKAYYVR